MLDKWEAGIIIVNMITRKGRENEWKNLSKSDMRSKQFPIC